MAPYRNIDVNIILIFGYKSEKFFPQKAKTLKLSFFHKKKYRNYNIQISLLRKGEKSMASPQSKTIIYILYQL